MASSPDGKPLDESPEDLFLDSINLLAFTSLGNIAYGIMLVLYAICVHYLWTQKTSDTRRTAIFYLCYTTTMALLGTLYIISNARIADLAYVKHRLYHEGPGSYVLFLYSRPGTMFGLASWMLINFMADGLVLWRFTVIYRDTQFFYLITVVPYLMYVGNIGFGLFAIVQSAGVTFRAREANYVVPYITLSISVTCYSTLAILGRLRYHRRHIRRVGLATGNQYTSIAAMLIESAALHTLFCLVYVILFGINHAMQWIMLSLLSQVQIIAPLLIIFRISRGRAWTRDTHSTLLSTFSLPAGQHTQP